MVAHYAVGPTLGDCTLWLAGLHLLVLVIVLVTNRRENRIDAIDTLHVWMLIFWFSVMMVGIIVAAVWQIYSVAVFAALIMTVVSLLGAFGLHKLTEKYGTPASRKR